MSATSMWFLSRWKVLHSLPQCSQQYDTSVLNLPVSSDVEEGSDFADTVVWVEKHVNYDHKLCYYDGC